MIRSLPARHVIAGAARALVAAAVLPATLASAPARTSRPSVPFSPNLIRPFPDSELGITPDRGEVQLAGRIVQTEVALELFACTAGKEHESIVRLYARPKHIHAALLLIGLTPGRPAVWDKNGKMTPPTGDAVDVFVRYRRKGKLVEVPAHRWLRQAETHRPVGPLHWVFCGSQLMQDGTYLADVEGTVITVVNFGGAVLDLPAENSSSNADLWVAANPKTVPPLDTGVVVILRPHVSVALTIRVDRFGRVLLGDTFVTPTGLRHRIQIALKANPDLRVRLLRSPNTLTADVDAVAALLQEAGVKPTGIRRLRTHPETEPAASQPALPAPDPKALEQFISDPAARFRALLDAAVRDHRRLIQNLAEQGKPWRNVSDHWRRFIGPLQNHPPTPASPETRPADP